MKSFYSPKINRLSAAINAAVVLLVMTAVVIALNWQDMPAGLTGFLAIRITVKNLLLGSLCVIGGAWAFYVFGFTESPTADTLWTDLRKVATAASITTAVAFLFPLTSHASTFRNPAIYSFFPLAVLACIAGRLAARACAGGLTRSLDEPCSLLIVGSGARALSLYNQVRESQQQRFEVLGFVEFPQNVQVPTDIRPHILGTLDDLESILMSKAVDRVMITLPVRSCHAQIQTALTTCERVGIEAQCYVSDIFELSLARPTLEPQGNVSVISMKVVRDDQRLMAKRAIDIVLAVIGLILFAPLMLAIGLAITTTSPGPAIFVQERFGFRKRRFRMFKFRTMRRDAEVLQAGLENHNEIHGPTFKMRNDPRVTPLGRWLRRTSLDELPQLLNVLKGEMSLVGPRPLPVRDVSRFSEASLMRRFSVKPGLTCLWQISGRSKTGFEDWIRLDLKYIDEWSLGLDLKILLKTVPVVLKADGAY